MMRWVGAVGALLIALVWWAGSQSGDAAPATVVAAAEGVAPATPSALSSAVGESVPERVAVAARQVEVVDAQGIAGRVSCHGLPFAGARLEVRTPEGRGQALRALVSDSDGIFDFADLAPATYRLVVRPPRGRGVFVEHARLVAAPNRDVTVPLDVATLRLRVVDRAGHEMRGSDFSVVAETTGMVGAWFEPIAIDFPPGANVDLRARHVHGGVAESSVEMPARGTIDVDLVVEPVVLPSVELRLLGAEAAEVDGVRLDFRAEATGESSVLHAERGSGDLFVIAAAELASGFHDVVVRPGSAGGAGWYVLPTTSRVWVPATGTVNIGVPLTLGARCKLELGGHRSVEPTDTIRLVDAGGSVVVEFGRSQYFAAGADDVFPPGAYTLVVEAEGYRRHVEPVLLEAGKTAVISVDLQRLR